MGAIKKAARDLKTRRQGKHRQDCREGRADRPGRRTPATACRRLSKLAERVDGRYRIVSQPPDRDPVA